jgi:predicted DsbA family dithiol-disulfide isomerase
MSSPSRFTWTNPEFFTYRIVPGYYTAEDLLDRLFLKTLAGQRLRVWSAVSMVDLGEAVAAASDAMHYLASDTVTPVVRASITINGGQVLHAAFAAEAAAAQGKFWQMHDYIFHHQHTTCSINRHPTDANLAQFAEVVGLDMQQYARDMAEQRALARIEEDVESGLRSGVQGTPTFFINGVLYRGSWEHDALLAAVQAASRTA